MDEDQDGNFFRTLSCIILNRISEYSDGGMTIIMYACLINLDNNMNLGITNSLKKEVGHLKSLKEVVEVGSTDIDKLGIISASLIILSNLNKCWEYRTNILDKVMFFINTMSDKFETMKIEQVGDKVLVCLTLVLISKFIAIFGSEKEDKGEEDKSKRSKDGHKNLGKLLNFLFSIINNADTPNSCYLFALDVTNTCFEIYSSKKMSSKTYRKNMDSFTHTIFLSLLDSFSSQVELRYFNLVIGYFKFFNKNLCASIPGEQLTKFVILLSRTIEKEVKDLKIQEL